jgi:hypothetical protein
MQKLTAHVTHLIIAILVSNTLSLSLSLSLSLTRTRARTHTHTHTHTHTFFFEARGSQFFSQSFGRVCVMGNILNHMNLITVYYLLFFNFFTTYTLLSYMNHCQVMLILYYYPEKDMWLQRSAMMLHPRSKARSALPSSSCLLSDATLHNFFCRLVFTT